MCGIAGVISLQNTDIDLEEIVSKMNDEIAHRGPDGEGVYRNDGLCFGHRRLSIIDLEHAAQPMHSKDGILTYNGEIYNFRKLRDELSKNGVLFDYDSDTEVLLKSLDYFGVDDALAKSNGMFAFAHFDKHTKELTIARDRMGIKPLYYFKNDEFFIFCSEVKGILASGLVPLEFNQSVLKEHFIHGFVTGKETYLKSIYKVLPGERIVLKNGGVDRKIYWDLVGESLKQEKRKEDLDQFSKDFEKEIKKSLELRLISDVDVALLLSSGIDSSILAELIARNKRSDISFFTAGDKDKEIDESKIATEFSKTLSERYDVPLKLEKCQFEDEDFDEQFTKLTWFHDEPIVFENSLPMNSLFSGCRKLDYKVVLSGEGADEIFIGYNRQFRTAKTLSSLKSNQIDAEIFLGGGIDNIDIVNNLTNGAEKSLGEIHGHQWLEKYVDLSPLQKLTFYLQRFRLQTILQRQDRMSMACSTECRVPFLDHNMVLFANSISEDFKYKDQSNSKSVLREWGKDYLDKRSLLQSKKGFPTSVNSWLRSEDANRYIKRLTDSSLSISKQYLDSAVLEKVFEDHFSGKKYFDVIIWELLALEKWWQVMSLNYGEALAE